ncbi:mandelate racemase/muconate lactonizing enzyme family protein [Halocalculus aciditolerans]|uniref:o-succinylbenzoate synthase n=1 Tax=Halocalculus aciditolerans TaxID=1383812 RepID=A0A830FHL8_9EURY|nr:enolase C-terminal domain-like protein [Halocalculus aciditolerans]GGL56964.1 chloromuconate cycloisomerase [Halocalculus aciditolerans]
MSVEAFALPLATPLETAAGRIEEREGFLFAARGGTGEATPLPGWTESLAACERALRDADEKERWSAALAACEGAPAARHAVSQACLDARARAADRPLYRELGGERECERVPVNATVGDADVEGTLSAVETAVHAGFETVKVKVGARAVAADADRLDAVRSAYPRLELRADANAAWDEAEARAFLDATSGLDLAYVEQPVPGVDALARLTSVGPVAADESVVDAGVDACLDAGVAAVVLKPMALGGLDRARDAAFAALDAGVTPVVSNTVDAAYARSGAVHLAASLPDPAPAGLATGGRFARDLVPDATPVRNGYIAVPRGNGHAIGGSAGE